MKDQSLKFEPLAIFGIVKSVYGLDLTLEAEMIQKFGNKQTVFSTRGMYCSNSEFI